MIIDDEDYDRLRKYIWRTDPAGYVFRCAGGKIRMARQILKAPRGIWIRWINGNKLDNRKENLRLYTRSQLTASSKMFRTNTTGYRGVYWLAPKKRWMVIVIHLRRRHFCGYFRDPHSAAEAYNRKALDLRGKFARLNVIDRSRSISPPSCPAPLQNARAA
ncbi:MAG: HNH endonuclease [Vicinamibacterales bacterium]|nr:HNH endonuclease [Vicinamibacterales bacterium]